MTSVADLVTLFRKQFILCQVHAEETVGVLYEGESRAEYVEAAFAALETLGCAVFAVRVPSGQRFHAPYVRSGAGPGLTAMDRLPGVIELLKSVNMVVDLTKEGLIHTLDREVLLSQGGRVLLVVEPPEVLARLLPDPEFKEEVMEAAARLTTARRMHVTSEAGTHLEIDIEGVRGFGQYGMADTPGHWDHWPSGFVACYPDQSKVHGTIVLMPGDVLLPFKTYVSEPVRVEIKSGVIQSLTGGKDAIMLRDYLEAAEDPRAWGISHVGWGLLKGAHWGSLVLYDKQQNMGMEVRSVRGNFMWSTGPNRNAGRLTLAHLDIPMRNCSVYLDEECVVDAGRVL